MQIVCIAIVDPLATSKTIGLHVSVQRFLQLSDRWINAHDAETFCVATIRQFFDSLIESLTETKLRLSKISFRCRGRAFPQ